MVRVRVPSLNNRPDGCTHRMRPETADNSSSQNGKGCRSPAVTPGDFLKTTYKRRGPVRTPRTHKVCVYGQQLNFHHQLPLAPPHRPRREIIARFATAVWTLACGHYEARHCGRAGSSAPPATVDYLTGAEPTETLDRGLAENAVGHVIDPCSVPDRHLLAATRKSRCAAR